MHIYNLVFLCRTQDLAAFRVLEYHWIS